MLTEPALRSKRKCPGALMATRASSIGLPVKVPRAWFTRPTCDCICWPMGVRNNSCTRVRSPSARYKCRARPPCKDAVSTFSSKPTRPAGTSPAKAAVSSLSAAKRRSPSRAWDAARASAAASPCSCSLSWSAETSSAPFSACPPGSHELRAQSHPSLSGSGSHIPWGRSTPTTTARPGRLHPA